MGVFERGFLASRFFSFDHTGKVSCALLSYCCTYCCTAILLYCHTAVLPHCCTAILLYCHIAVLPHCCTAILPYCYTAVLLYCHTAVLLYCHTAILLYCYTAILLYCHLHAHHLQCNNVQKDAYKMPDIVDHDQTAP